MLKVYMKSGAAHVLDLSFPEFEELQKNEQFDSFFASDADNASVHIIPVDNIESIEVYCTLDELKEDIDNGEYGFK